MQSQLKFSLVGALMLGGLVGATLLTSPSAQAETSLRVFSGGQNQRPDLMRKVFDEYQKANPGVKIDIETGGATSELQRQYLSTVLNAQDSAIDVFMVDIVNPAQYAKAGWLEPLDSYLGKDAATQMKNYLPVYAQADVIGGKIMALPAFADAMFMYYRKDLLDKYKIKPPTTWDELAKAAMTIQKGENDPNLQGLSFQGAPIEGAVCTFLLPYWGQGKEFTDANGKLTLDKPAAEKGMNMWLDMVDKGVSKKNIAEVKTPDTVNEFKAGNVAFAINWGFAWDRFREDDSKVKDKVGVIPLPAMTRGKSATCVGGWQWTVSAFSKNKAEAVKLIRHMSTPDVAKFLAVEGSLLPVFPQLYTEKDVVKSNPWFASALPVVQAGKSRPVTPQYAQISDLIKNTTSAMLARIKTVSDGVAEIQTKAATIMP
ncbi:MAG: ABC transporter substrate-binding protein [Alphaproteobacteria bacterium]|nr:ABC transporter substrate-binding protein [Alphaproteobacteria bacterium]